VPRMTSDSEAAVRGAPASGAGEAALDALRLDYGHVYLIGCDDTHGWWASRRGVVGVYLTGSTPDELRAAVAADYGPRAGVQWGRAR
jgi:hypothetical protein